MSKRAIIVISIAAAQISMFCAAVARADDAPSYKDDQPSPSAWLIELGGYGVLQPKFEGARDYNLGFKPIVDIRAPGDRVWLSFPNDAFTYDLYETANFHAGAAGDISLQSRDHGDNLDWRLGSANIDVKLGVFAEYYPVDSVRTRVEVLEAVSGFNGLMVNLAADYIWRPEDRWTLTLGPRAMVVDDSYASELFSARIAAAKKGAFVRYSAEGGLHSLGAEFTGNYDWTKTVSTKLFIDYSQLVGDAADSPLVNVRGNPDQVLVGIGASYKFSIDR